MNRFQHTFSKCKKSHYDVPAGKCNNFDKSLVTGQRPPLRYKIQIGLKIILKKYFLATAFSQHIYQIYILYWIAIVEFIFYKKATEIWRNLTVLIYEKVKPKYLHKKIWHWPASAVLQVQTGPGYLLVASKHDNGC